MQTYSSSIQILKFFKQQQILVILQSLLKRFLNGITILSLTHICVLYFLAKGYRHTLLSFYLENQFSIYFLILLFSLAHTLYQYLPTQKMLILLENTKIFKDAFYTLSDSLFFYKKIGSLEFLVLDGY
jgi:hypothetical protein